MSRANRVTVDSYDTAAREYEERDRTRSREGFYNEWIDDFVARLHDGARVLEIGSAYGRDANYMESRGVSVQRSDASPAFVDTLRESHEALSLNIVDNPAANQYDGVFASAVFLHFTPEDMDNALTHIHDSLYADGFLGFSLIEGAGDKWTDAGLKQSRYFRYWSMKELIQKLERTGFTIVDKRHTEYQGRVWLYITAQKRTVLSERKEC